MTHTQGKLTATVFDEGFFSIKDDSGDPIGEVYGGANAFRIVACWNTCDGISTEHLEGGIAGVLTRVRKGVRMAEHGLGMGRSMTTTLTDQELEDIYELHANEDIDGWVYDHDAIARAVIAAHEAKLLAGVEMPEPFSMEDDQLTYTGDQLKAYAAAAALNARREALTETHGGITMPADYSFATVNDYVHSMGVHFENLQALCLGMALALPNAEVSGLSTRPPGYRAGTQTGEK